MMPQKNNSEVFLCLITVSVAAICAGSSSCSFCSAAVGIIRAATSAMIAVAAIITAAAKKTKGTPTGVPGVQEACQPSKGCFCYCPSWLACLCSNSDLAVCYKKAVIAKPVRTLAVAIP